MKKILLCIFESHNFFIKESPKYVEKLECATITTGYFTSILHPFTQFGFRYKLTFKQWIYYPIAYIKFMYFQIKSFLNI